MVRFIWVEILMVSNDLRSSAPLQTTPEIGAMSLLAENFPWYSCMYMLITTRRKVKYHTNESYAAGLEHLLCFPVPANSVIPILPGESNIKQQL
jgi:hypothetical protein